MELVIAISLACLGAILGSFVGVVAERAYTGQSFLTGRSRCNSCARFLTPADLVPIVSYLATRGTCRGCGSRVPAAYLFLEGTLALTFFAAYLVLGLTIVLPVFLIALAVLAFIVVYDLRHTVVPTIASNALMALGALIAVLRADSLDDLGITVMIAGLIGLGFFLLYALSKGRAMGLGDSPIALALSLMCAPYAYGGLLLSFWIGAVIGILILVLRRGGPRMGIEVPFVPFLAIGYLLAFFFSWNPLDILML
ncbi:MAG TPA: prepilin peptidase [Candidatus Paceibacterota bacterium]|nr:prepilin peptidase [Candidatus Paceibacterota bacterium]